MKSILKATFLSSGTLRHLLPRQHYPVTIATPFSSVSMSLSSTSTPSSSRSVYPELLVYDLDACLWDQEMFEMDEMPGKVVRGDLNGKGEGVVGVMSGGHKISLHKGGLVSLQEHWDDAYPGMKVALASSANTPFAEQVGRASLKMLDVVPGVTVWDVLMRDWDGVDVNQIGRQPPLSPNKSATHFPILREKTGVRYDRMLFFDDCNWADHCGMVERNCKEKDSGKGPATVRTPYGLGEKDFRKGLKVYATRNAK